METQTNPKLELLKRFCKKPGGFRDHLCSPIRRNGFLYATNGWIAIRIEDDPSIEASEGKETDTLHRIFEHGDIEFHELPALPDAIKCRYCKGTGIQYLEECSDCDGDGDFIHGNHRYDCKECDGSGEVDSGEVSDKPKGCFHCNGSGEADCTHGAIPTKVGGLYFQNHLLRMIVNLPNARIEHVTEFDEKSTPAAHFIFDGGEGAVMPFRV